MLVGLVSVATFLLPRNKTRKEVGCTCSKTPFLIVFLLSMVSFVSAEGDEGTPSAAKLVAAAAMAITASNTRGVRDGLAKQLFTVKKKSRHNRIP